MFCASAHCHETLSFSAVFSLVFVLIVVQNWLHDLLNTCTRWFRQDWLGVKNEIIIDKSTSEHNLHLVRKYRKCFKLSSDIFDFGFFSLSNTRCLIKFDLKNIVVNINLFYFLIFIKLFDNRCEPLWTLILKIRLFILRNIFVLLEVWLLSIFQLCLTIAYILIILWFCFLSNLWFNNLLFRSVNFHFVST